MTSHKGRSGLPRHRSGQASSACARSRPEANTKAGNGTGIHQRLQTSDRCAQNTDSEPAIGEGTCMLIYSCTLPSLITHSLVADFSLCDFCQPNKCDAGVHHQDNCIRQVLLSGFKCARSRRSRCTASRLYHTFCRNCGVFNNVSQLMALSVLKMILIRRRSCMEIGYCWRDFVKALATGDQSSMRLSA